MRLADPGDDASSRSKLQRETAGDGSLVSFRAMLDPTRTAVGTWSGGRFMRFGEPIDDDPLGKLLRPDDGIRTVLTADVYGEGEADRLLGRALDGVPREDYCLVGAIGHDFYNGAREG